MNPLPHDSLPANLFEPADPKHVLIRNRFVRVPRKLELTPLATAQLAIRVEYEHSPAFTVPLVLNEGPF